MTGKHTEDDYKQEALKIFDEINKHFASVDDPRRKGSVRYPLSHILFITICAVTCGCNNLKAVAEYAKTKKEWLCEILGSQSGVPSYYTFWMFFCILSPTSLATAFSNWVASMADLCKGAVVAIDGKAQRGTANSQSPNSFVHIVSAWASASGLTLGQVKVDGKSNEITAIPKLLLLLDLEGTVVTMDAMGAQKELAEQIIEKKGDYIIALKGNQSSLHAEVINYFDQAREYGEENIDYRKYRFENIGHGRHEIREVFTTSDLEFLPQKLKWKGLQSIVCVHSTRTVNGKTSEEDRFYISSLVSDPESIGKNIRSHWGIENGAHWILDVAFREDEQQAKAGNIAENLSVIRRICLNALKQDRTVKAGIEIKRQKAGWDNNYLLRLLGVK